jgi:hypothetical protein
MVNKAPEHRRSILKEKTPVSNLARIQLSVENHT